MTKMQVDVTANIGSYTSSMDQAAQIGDDRMGRISGSVDDFRKNLILASDDIKRAALVMGSSMAAANDSIMQGSIKASQAVNNIATNAANDGSFKLLGDGLSKAVGDSMYEGVKKGLGISPDELEKKGEEYGDLIGTGIMIGIATAIGTFVGNQVNDIFNSFVSDVQTALDEVVAGVKDAGKYVAGFFDGSSYKTQVTDDFIKTNDQVKLLQSSLFLTANDASSLNAALSKIGTSKTDYISVFQKADVAIRSNSVELDRLGVKYNDAQGHLLSISDFVKNANTELEKYTKGWDRNSAAAAIGLGTAEQVAAAAAVTQDKIKAAADEINKYNLGIGPESQAAAARYEEATKNYQRANDLTSQGFKRAWSDIITPILTRMEEYFTAGMPRAVNIFRDALATLVTGIYIVDGAFSVAANTIIGNAKAIGDAVGGIAGASAAIMHGDLTGAKDAMLHAWEDAKTHLASSANDILKNAQENAKAVRLAWALDDRSATATGESTRGHGKSFIKPYSASESASESAPKDDIAKKTMEQGLKAQEDLIADEKKMLQTRNDFLKQDYDSDLISASTYYSSKENFIKSSSDIEVAGYNKEIAILTTYKATREKISERIDADTKIAEAERKSMNAQQQAAKDLAKTYLELYNEKKKISDSFATPAQSEDKRYKKELETLQAFKNARVENESEANNLIETETQRHNAVMLAMDQQTNQMKLESASSVANDLMNLLQSAGAQQTAFGKAVFLAQKGLAVAEIILSTQAAAAAAIAPPPMGLGPIAGAGMAATITATGYIRAGIAAATAIQGFADGGDPPVGMASLVGERGPELFVPKGAGTIIPNEMLRGNGSGDVTIINKTSGRVDKVTQQSTTNGGRQITIEEVWAELDNPNSKGSRSIKRNLQVERRRS